MSDHHETRGVHVSAGQGIVAHLSNLTAFATGDETRLNELLVRLNALKDAPWHEVVRTLTAGIAESNYDAHPDLACVSISEDRVAALVFGDTSLTITTDQNDTTLCGRDSSTWIDVAIHGVVDRVLAGDQSDSVIVGVLRDGVVPAGGFLLDTSGPMPSSTRWVETTAAVEPTTPLEPTAPPPVPVGEATSEPISEYVETTYETATAPPAKPATIPETDDPVADDADEDERSLAGIFARLDQRYRSEDAERAQEMERQEEPPNEDVPSFGDTTRNGSAPEHDAGSAPESPAPASAPSSPTTLAPARRQLRGVLCPDGHLTNTNDVSCRTCGLDVAPNAAVVMGDRPVLGQLTFDDGAVLSIDRPAAVGSDVPPGYEIDGEPATIVRLDDGLNGVSAVQVEVRTVGWDVEIHDMNSENGTYTILQGERQTRTRLRAGQSVALQEGMMVEVGGRSFTYSLGSTANQA